MSSAENVTAKPFPALHQRLSSEHLQEVKSPGFYSIFQKPFFFFLLPFSLQELNVPLVPTTLIWWASLDCHLYMIPDVVTRRRGIFFSCFYLVFETVALSVAQPSLEFSILPPQLPGARLQACTTTPSWREFFDASLHLNIPRRADMLCSGDIAPPTGRRWLGSCYDSNKPEENNRYKSFPSFPYCRFNWSVG